VSFPHRLNFQGNSLSFSALLDFSGHPYVIVVTRGATEAKVCCRTHRSLAAHPPRFLTLA
jgi:hypothetical protein